MIVEMITGLWNYYMCIALMMIGLYIVIARDNLVKKMMGLNIFQVAVIMMYVSMAKVKGGTAPIIPGYEAPHGDSHGEQVTEAATHGAELGVDAAIVLYSNPLPHVLMLTAIVVGVATTAVGLALIVRIQEAYGSVEEDSIAAMDLKEEMLGR